MPHIQSKSLLDKPLLDKPFAHQRSVHVSHPPHSGSKRQSTPLIQANSVSYQFDDGEYLFQGISCTLNHRRIGLVGRNGVGKSIFASLLIKKLEPTQGSVLLNARVASYSQLPSELLESEMSIAEYLKLDEVIMALDRVEAGECTEALFSTIGEQWTVKGDLEQQLRSMKLPPDAHFPCRLLSGGQLARLRLWQLFQSDVELLVLDEPSNHLDADGRSWLVNQMQRFSGYLLLISHDRQLLREMDRIWELTTLGLTQFGGHFDFYLEQKNQEVIAIERQINSVTKQQKHIETQAQKNKEKYEQRAAKGNALRKTGGVPKIVLNQRRSDATASVSNRLKNEGGRRELLREKEKSLRVRQEQLKAQKVYMAEGDSRARHWVTIVNGQLPYVQINPINLQLSSSVKLHLQGGNGSGKSTLLKVMLGDVEDAGGEWRINAPLYYLDQHFGLMKEQLSMLDNVVLFCDGLLENDARTLLAGIGFRRDDVHRTVNQLSGGEKMKLSMLVVSHQEKQPLLLLDEPDNHLDLESKNILAEGLRQYKGPFVLVSHDVDFVKESGVNQVYRLD
ncbi:ATP-binding cassette domain-containing protein [Vibrio amylolyticus]|uniref:ATP-binding cassette domain-containing protein n=1 Tax=Vibrio amylolyticus TaxID=2847292 RepID=UPI0035534C3D